MLLKYVKYDVEFLKEKKNKQLEASLERLKAKALAIVPATEPEFSLDDEDEESLLHRALELSLLEHAPAAAETSTPIVSNDMMTTDEVL